MKNSISTLVSVGLFSMFLAASAIAAEDPVLLGGIGFDEFTTAGRTWTRLKGGSQTYADSIGNRYSDIEGGRKADGSTEPYVQRTIIYWDGTHGSSDWNTQISLGVGSLGKVANTSTVGEQFLNSANSFDDTLYSNSSTAANGVPQVTTDSALQLNIDSGFSTTISINAIGYSLTELAFSALTASADVTISLGLWNGTTTTALDISKLISGATMTAYSFDLSGLDLENDQIDLVLSYAATDGTLLTLDNIQVLGTAAVPEPATYAQILAGLALTGAVAHRRRRQSPQTA